MNNEIKEILDMFIKYKDEWYSCEYILKPKQCVMLLDHITNIEKENKEQLDENYKLSEWLVKKQKRIEELEKENKHLNDLLDNSNNECEKLRNKQDKAIKTLKDTSVDMPSTLLIETIDYARHQLLGGDE